MPPALEPVTSTTLRPDEDGIALGVAFAEKSRDCRTMKTGSRLFQKPGNNVVKVSRATKLETCKDHTKKKT